MNIAVVIIQMDDGRAIRLGPDDLDAVRRFACHDPLTEHSDPNLWRLLAFLGSLAPAPPRKDKSHVDVH